MMDVTELTDDQLTGAETAFEVYLDRGSNDREDDEQTNADLIAALLANASALGLNADSIVETATASFAAWRAG